MNNQLRYLRTITLLTGIVFALVTTSGCSRRFWREQADRDSYELIAEKMNDPDWVVPRMDITPDPRSRFYDPNDPDHTPLPPDDEAANEFLHEVGGWKGYKSWHEFGRSFSVENPHWIDNLVSNRENEETILQTSAEGTVSRQAGLTNLNLGELIELSYIHNRDYQREVENVYLQALDVSEERFAFDVRYLGVRGTTPRLNVDGTFNGRDVSNGSDTVRFTSGFGISQALPSGAQWALELTNNTLWVFSGGSAASASAISYSIVQPLMRNAGRKIGLENLTLSERQLLYAVRDLARFRKIFFGDVAGTSGYLGLLRQHQVIANQRDNITRLERQVEALSVINSKGREDEGVVFDIDIAQLASQLTSQRNALRQLEASLQDAYDRFKIELGLPPDLAFTIDTSELKMFEVIAPETLEMETRVFNFKENTWGALDLPTPDEVETRQILDAEEYRHRTKVFRELYEEVIETVIGGIEEDLKKVDSLIEVRGRDMTPEEREKFEQNIERDRTLFADAKRTLSESLAPPLPKEDKGKNQDTQLSVEENFSLIDEILKQPELTNEDKARVYELGSEIHKILYKTIQNLEVVQVNLRVETVVLEPFDLSLEEVTQLALENRLDLKNSLAILNDSRRNVEIAANDLEAALNLAVEGDYGTQSNNPIEFRGSESNVRAGIQFDTPLDQLQERNSYRAAQIAYQRARRDYMAAEDRIKQEVREAWRQLQVLKLNFETSRESIRIAAIQLDNSIESAAEAALQVGGGNRSRGLELLNALGAVLRAQNDFIQTWTQYEQNRINIYRDMGIMKVDDKGVWGDPYYQSLAYPGQETPKTVPNRTKLQPIPESDREWDTGLEIPPAPDRSEAKALLPRKLPPAPAKLSPVEIPQALPENLPEQSTQTQPRNGLPGGTSSQIITRPRSTDLEELRNAQQQSPATPFEFDIPPDSAQWKLPVVR